MLLIFQAVGQQAGSVTMNKKFITNALSSSAKVILKVSESEQIISLLESISEATVDAYNNNKKTLFIGNGGSAADAQHLAAEFVSRFNFDRPALASLALTTDTSVLTAISNDYGYENVFSRQVQAIGVRGDILFAFSTSGTSKNIIKALKVAKEKEMIVVSFTGEYSDQLSDLSDYCIKIPSKTTSIIQECHGIIGHIICSYVEEVIFAERYK